MTVLARFPRDGRDELVVIGAARAGSTSLHNYLALHIYLVRDPVERPQPSEETLARVRAIPAPEVAELRELTGLPLAGWSV
jgi:hypothetical protein